MPDDRWPPGDGDPCEYGGTYRDGRRCIHPPWGPIEVDDGPLPWLKAVPPRLPWWRRIWRRKRG